MNRNLSAAVLFGGILPVLIVGDLVLSFVFGGWIQNVFGSDHDLGQTGVVAGLGFFFIVVIGQVIMSFALFDHITKRNNHG